MPHSAGQRPRSSPPGPFLLRQIRAVLWTVFAGRLVNQHPGKNVSSLRNEMIPGVLNPRSGSDDHITKTSDGRGAVMFKIVGAVIWIVVFAMVLSSVFRSEKINAAPQSVGQLHHTAKTLH